MAQLCCEAALCFLKTERVDVAAVQRAAARRPQTHDGARGGLRTFLSGSRHYGERLRVVRSLRCAGDADLLSFLYSFTGSANEALLPACIVLSAGQ